ncbi:AsmA family protein [bacterium]|nr:AsmA family protein [bacterium]
MKKFKKIILIFVLLLLFIFVGGTVALRIAFPPAKVKALLIAKMSEVLHREVQIESISIGLRGLKVKSFKVSEKPSFDKGTFVQARQFMIKPNLLALLKKQISISEVTLISPKINIIRRADGSFNFSDLMVKKVTEAKKEEKAEKIPPAKVKPIPFSFLVSKVSISGGDVNFIDRTPQKLSADLKNINLSVYGISLVSPFFVEGSLDVEKEKLRASLVFKGSINIKEESIKIKESLVAIAGAGIGATGSVEKFMEPDKLSFAVNIKSERFALEKLSKIFPFSGNLLMAGEPDISADVSGNLKRIGIRGNIGFRKVEVLFKDLFHKPAGIEGGIGIDIILEDNNILKLNSISIALGGMKASSSGKVAGLKGEMALNLKVALEKFDMKSLQELVPLAKDYGLAGMVGGETEISGGLKSLNISGRIGVENVTSIQKEMTVKLDRSNLNYSGNILDFKKPTANFALDIGTVEVKMVEKPKEPKEGKPTPKEVKQEPLTVAEKPSVKVAIPADVTLSGNIKLKKLSFQNYQVSDCSAKLDLAKSMLNLKLLSLSAYSGSVKGNLSADLMDSSLESLKFNLDGDVKNIDIHQVIQATGFEPKGQFYAIASGQMKVSGRGKDFSKLNGSGLVGIKDVKIKGIKILDRIASAANIPEFKETSFKSGSGTLTIEKWKVHLANVKTDGGDKLDAYCSGNADLIRKTQDIKGDIKFTKKYSGGDLAKCAGDAEGRVTVPFKIGGTFEDPKVNLDWGKLTKKAAEKAAEDVLKKEIEKGLKKLFKK